LLHTNLTTKKALEYGAALRFPVDTSPEEREKRVEEVLKLLELTERADLRIDKLSGGQRKRTSVALELLTEPALLFLDEPTSGLDPGLDRSVMKMLRNLADDGRTVVVVTHSVANLDVCDDVIIMAPGGHLAYFGSPQTVFTQFKANDWAGVFDELGEDKDKWATSTSTHIEKRINTKK
jgi:ABC transport system ATP-binding/permease protein